MFNAWTKLLAFVCASLLFLGCEKNYRVEDIDVLVPDFPYEKFNSNQDTLLAQEQVSNDESVEEQDLEQDSVDIASVETLGNQDATIKNKVDIPASVETSASNVVPESQPENNSLDSVASNSPNLSNALASSDVASEQNVKKTSKQDAEKAFASEKREEFRLIWDDIKTIASKRGFSAADMKRLIPESISIENYIKYGELDKTENRLSMIDEKVSTVKVNESYVKKKLQAMQNKFKAIRMPKDVYDDYQVKLNRVKKLLKTQQFENANRSINEVSMDLAQLNSIDELWQ